MARRTPATSRKNRTGRTSINRLNSHPPPALAISDCRDYDVPQLRVRTDLLRARSSVALHLGTVWTTAIETIL